MTIPNEPRARPREKIVGWTTSMALPAAVFFAAVLVDLNASSRLTSDAGRPALLALAAGIMQIVLLLALAPWWGARLVEKEPFGALVAGIRVLAMTLATTLPLVVLMSLETHAAPLVVLKAQTVVLGVGLLAAGLAAALGAIFRSVRGVAAFTSLLGFALAASPFWGNVVVRWAPEVWKSCAVNFIAGVTPLSACADAVRYDLFRGRMLYTISLVSDYPHRLPDWWLYALITAAAGILLLELAAFIRSRRHPSAS